LSDFGSKRFVIYVFRVDDSRWIKFLAIVTAWLTAVLVALTIVLGIYVWRLDVFDGLTGHFAAIYSTSKPDTGTIPEAYSHRNACNESNTNSYTDTDAVTKSSAYAGAPSDSSTPPPITSLIDFEHLFHKRSYLFIYTHNEALSVVAITDSRLRHPAQVIETREREGDFKEW
jgi:hypothetical protein